MAFDWAGIASLINTGYGIWADRQPPKFHQAPPTPAEEWALNARKDQYQNNAARNYVGEYAKQFMQGMNLQPNFQVNNSRDGKSEFMGGIKMPQFDPSKFPTIGGPTKPVATGPDLTGPNGISGKNPDTSAQQPNGIPAGAGGNDPFYGMPSKPNAQNYTWDDVKRIAAQHGPEALSLLSGGGLVSLGINGAINFIRSRFGGQQAEPLPQTNTKRPIDALTPAGYTGTSQQQYAAWLAEQQRIRDQKWEQDYEKTRGAQGISQALSGQDSRGFGRRGRIKAF